MSMAPLTRNTIIGLVASVLLAIGKFVAGVVGHSSALVADGVRATAGGVEGVRLVEKVHARKSGRGFLVDMHLHVSPELDVRSAHALAGKVKALVKAQHAVVRHVLIHIEPDERDAPGRAGRDGSAPERGGPRPLTSAREEVPPPPLRRRTLSDPRSANSLISVHPTACVRTAILPVAPAAVVE